MSHLILCYNESILERERSIYMTVKEKEKELLRMSDRDLINRILAFPDREYLNRDEEGKRRKYPSAEMAINARRNIERIPGWTISDKQKWAMAHSFAEYSNNELKVSGIKFAKADPNELQKEMISQHGVKTVYEMDFHLVPEPENEHDKNAVAVYVRNESIGDLDVAQKFTKIGYVPAAYTGVHPIANAMIVKGMLTDHSNGHFKTISYTMNMDTEAIDKEFAGNNRTDMYTYRMPFILNGNAKEGAADYMNSKRWTGPDGEKSGWEGRINDELEFYGVNGHVDNVYFEFPGGKAGSIVAETSSQLNKEAMAICGSYFRYCLETNISSDLTREQLVDVPQNLCAINTREHMYFSLQSEPVDDFTKAVEAVDRMGQCITSDQTR